MHDLSCETAWTKYTLRGVLRDPLTATAVGLSVAGSGVSAAGTLMGGKSANQAAMFQAVAAEQSGIAARDAKVFEAKQLDQAAQEARAIGQRSALEKRRETALVQSTLQARAAAGGGGASDPGVATLAGQIAERGEYEALFDMFRGESRGRGLDDSATGARMTGDALLAESRGKAMGLRMEGNAKQKASQMAALGTLIGGAGSAFGQYRQKYG